MFSKKKFCVFLRTLVISNVRVRGFRYLASSGKDRSLCLYAHNPATNTYETVVIKKSAHKRIVWGCR